MTAVSLTTERLLLRPWVPQDINPFTVLCGDTRVMRWIGDGSTRTPAECLEIIEKFEGAWEKDGFGIFAIEHRNSGHFIGFCGLSIPGFLPEILPAVEIGWRLAEPNWGKGFATEAARTTVDFAFGQVGLKRLVAIYQIGNAASARITKKLGMKVTVKTVDPSCGRGVEVCELNREQAAPVYD